MGDRRFRDRDGQEWDVRVVSRGQWEFSPAGDTPDKPRTCRAPGYERDPFELSIEELQKLFDESAPAAARRMKSPFKD